MLNERKCFIHFIILHYLIIIQSNNAASTNEHEVLNGFELTNHSLAYLNETKVLKSQLSIDRRDPDAAMYIESAYNLVDEFSYLKELAWNDMIAIVDELSSSKDSELVAMIIKKLKRMSEILYAETKLELNDALRFLRILEKFFSLNKSHFILDESQVDDIYFIVDNLIYLNEFLSVRHRPTIFEELNSRFNNSALKLIESLDQMTKHIHFKKNNTKEFKYKNFASMITISKATDERFPFVMKQFVDVYDANSNLFDSISLNEEVLKKIYENNTIRVTYKIFFNKKLNSNANSLNDFELIDRAEFYKNIQKPKNFFYEITNSLSGDDENDEFNVSSASYFVSSNVLSASIDQIDPSMSRANVFVAESEMKKFVRIQFVIDLNQFHFKENERSLNEMLQCVFWNQSLADWSTNGCVASMEETTKLLRSNQLVKVCYCSHLTNFALLFDPKLSDYLSNDYDEEDWLYLGTMVKFLTCLGILVSSVCYLILIISRIDCYNFKSNKQASRQQAANFASSSVKTKKKVAFNLKPTVEANHKDETLQRLYLSNTITLLATNLLFALNFIFIPILNYESLGDGDVDYRVLFKVCASLLHYFILTSFCISLGTAWQHFAKLVTIFKYSYKQSLCLKLLTLSFVPLKFFSKWLMLSLTLPLIFSITGHFFLAQIEASSFSSYYLYSYSYYYWFKSPHLYYFFVGPLSFLLTTSLIFYVSVAIKVAKIQKKSSTNQSEDMNDNEESLTFSHRKLVPNYNRRRVIVLLLFSFVSLGLTWLVGFLVVITSYTKHFKYLRLLTDLLFCLFNSFHGLSLLIGQYLARKYSRSPSINTFTAAKSSTESVSTPASLKEDKMPPLNSKIKLTCATRFFLIYYGLFYICRRLFHCKRKRRYKDEENKMAEPYLEFKIVNFDDQKFNTTQTHLPTDNAIRVMPSFVDASSAENFKLNLDLNSMEFIDQEPYSSSV